MITEFWSIHVWCFAVVLSEREVASFAFFPEHFASLFSKPIWWLRSRLFWKQSDAFRKSLETFVHSGTSGAAESKNGIFLVPKFAFSLIFLQLQFFVYQVMVFFQLLVPF